jgi:hypothetical protein
LYLVVIFILPLLAATRRAMAKGEVKKHSRQLAATLTSATEITHRPQ